LFPTEGEPAPAPDPAAVAMRHLAFAVDRADFEAARETFEESGTEYRFADHEISHSLYIADPDGHRIELTTYELG
jgi:catechol-2,3-dioxygenase